MLNFRERRSISQPSLSWQSLLTGVRAGRPSSRLDRPFLRKRRLRRVLARSRRRGRFDCSRSSLCSVETVERDYFWHNPLVGARVERLTDFEGDELDAAISPDGKFAIFSSDRSGEPTYGSHRSAAANSPISQRAAFLDSSSTTVPSGGRGSREMVRRFGWSSDA